MLNQFNTVQEAEENDGQVSLNHAGASGNMRVTAQITNIEFGEEGSNSKGWSKEHIYYLFYLDDTLIENSTRIDKDN